MQGRRQRPVPLNVFISKHKEVTLGSNVKKEDTHRPFVCLDGEGEASEAALPWQCLVNFSDGITKLFQARQVACAAHKSGDHQITDFREVICDETPIEQRGPVERRPLWVLQALVQHMQCGSRNNRRY